MQVAVVENGVVVDLTPGDLEFADRVGLPLVEDEVQIGWIEDGPGFFRPPYDVVPKYRFLFELFADVEQLVLDATLTEADALLPAEMLDPNQDQRTADLIVIRNAWKRFQSLELIELGAPATVAFLNACNGLGVFGEFGDLRIADIRDNTAPA
jgi:hypothetical protein